MQYEISPQLAQAYTSIAPAWLVVHIACYCCVICLAFMLTAEEFDHQVSVAPAERLASVGRISRMHCYS